MYTKAGLGLLAAAGLTFGVIGMQTGSASPAPPLCANAGSGSTSSAGGPGVSGSALGNQGSANNANNGNEGSAGNGRGLGNNSGNGSNGGSNGGSGGSAGGSANGGTGTTPTTVNDTFLSVGGSTNPTTLPGGAVTTPPTNTRITGRSRYISGLLRLAVSTNTRR